MASLDGLLPQQDACPCHCNEDNVNVFKEGGARKRRRFVFGAAVFLLAAVAFYFGESFHTNHGVNVAVNALYDNRVLEDGDDNQNDDMADDAMNDDAASNDEADNDDAGADNDDAANNDEAEQDEQGEHDDTPIYVDDDYIDDFYAFEEEPGPPTLLPITAPIVVALLLAAMGATLAAGGGIGGGGIFVPVYIMVMQLPPRLAIPLSAVTVMGGAMASTLVNFRRRHPIADRPIIDWDIMLVMQPLILTGALIGTLLHRVLSEQILVVMLVVFLTITARAMLTKARKMYDAETKYIVRCGCCLDDSC